MSLRILFVSTDTRPIVGGIAKALDCWLSGLASSGHDVRLLSILPESLKNGAQKLPARPYQEQWLFLPDRIDKWADGFVVTRKLRTALYLYQQRRLVRDRFRQILDAFQPDWIIFSFLSPLCCTPLQEAKKRRLPCAAIAYGAEINPHRVHSPRWLRQTIAEFDRVIAISEYTKRLLVGWGALDDRVSIVHPGLDPDFVTRYLADRAISEQFSGPGEGAGIRLLTVCRLAERKGIQIVLKALPTLIQEFPDIHYDIVGDGSYSRELKNLVRELDIASQTHFHHNMADRDRDVLLSRCDLFVMVPLELADGDVEGFGIVYLEAGMFGKAVVGSHSGGVPDVVKQGKNGILATPADVQDAICAIRSLILDPARRAQLGQEGRRWAEQHTPASCAQSFLQALEISS